jgi:hypothetical protein
MLPLRFCLTAAIAAGCAQATAPAPAPMEVLFIGNSLTYVNDLPAMFAAVSAAGGVSVETGMSARPNLALIDHLTGSSDALTRLRSQHWDYVVLQQGPTTIGLCRDSLLLWARQFGPLVRSAGARPALLMVWPRADALDHFGEVRLAFQLAAQTVHGIFVPAGAAWEAVLATHPTIRPYGDDGFHPSPVGTYLTALVIYERLTGRDPRRLPAVPVSPAASPADESALREAAHAANDRYPADVGPEVTDSDSGRPPLPDGHC